MSLRVVFDFGAVLFRWRPAVVLAQHLPQQARSAAELRSAVAALFQGYGGDWGQFDLGLVDERELAERLSQRTGWPQTQLAALIAAVPDELRPQHAVLSLLLQLKARGRALSYLSNMPAAYADQLEQRYPLQHWFESGLFSARVQLSKPDPAMFALAAERFASAPRDCLLIDDHPANVEAARACGWQAELFVDAPRLRTALQARGLLG